MAITKKQRRERKSTAMNALVRDFIFAQGGDEDSFYDWNLPTDLGSLRVSVHAGYPDIFCRFDDTDQAAAALGGRYGRLNAYSGKWNFHFPDEWTVEDMFAAWLRELNPLRKECAVAA
jgi:hypothetical protein